MKTATLIIHGFKDGKAATETHEIQAFSMKEPSTSNARFVTTDGRVLETVGCVLDYKGDIDALPSVATPISNHPWAIKQREAHEQARAAIAKATEQR